MAPLIDADHRGPLLNLAAWITLVPMIVFVITKVLTKWRMSKVLHLDDGYMIFAAFIAIGQIIDSDIQVNTGLGQHRDALAPGQLEKYEKAKYASQILYILILGFSKMAAAQFLITLTRTKNKQSIAKGILIFNVIWLVIGVFCVSFQCQPPRTWDLVAGKCFNTLSFWTANAVMDLLSQLLIAFIPAYLLFNVKMNRGKKWTAILSFATNITTAPLTIIRLYYIFHDNTRGDITFLDFRTSLLTQIHANYSIMASCIPFMRPFIESLSVGLMTNDIYLAAEGDLWTHSSSVHKSDGRTQRVNPFGLLSRNGKTIITTRRHYPVSGRKGLGIGKGTFTSTITGGGREEVGNNIELSTPEPGLDRERYGSLERMVIREVRTTTIESAAGSLEPKETAKR